MENQKIHLTIPYDLNQLLTEDSDAIEESKEWIILNILYKHYDDHGRLFDEEVEPPNQNLYPIDMYRNKKKEK